MKFIKSFNCFSIKEYQLFFKGNCSRICTNDFFKVRPGLITRNQKVIKSQPLTLKNGFQVESKRQKIGPFNIYSVILFVLTGIGIVYYFEREKKIAVKRRNQDQNQSIGKPKIGGEFLLINQNGDTISDKDLKGKYVLYYFGFTKCPDVCPEELDKMAQVIEIVKRISGNILTPIFVTCDPIRDSPDTIKEYLKEFHTDIIGITGSFDDIKRMCKLFRVYFSTPLDVDPTKDDYLVDHSLFMYLMNPKGEFEMVFAKDSTSEDVALKICELAKQQVNITNKQ